MKTVNTYANAIAAIGNGGNEAYNSADAAEGAMATIASGIVGAIAQGNGEGFTIADVTITPAILQDYAQGNLPKSKKESEADLAGRPTKSALVAALTSTSEAISDALKSKVDAVAKIDSKKTAFATKMKAEGKRDKIEQALNSAKQPYYRAIKLAACVFCTVDEDEKLYFDTSTIAIESGALFARPIATADQPKPDFEPITWKSASDMFKKERAPQTATGKSDEVTEKAAPVVTNVTDDSVTVTTEATRPGGEQRKMLPDALEKMAEMLKALDGVNMKEREQVAAIWIAAGNLLDDQAKAEAVAEAA